MTDYSGIQNRHHPIFLNISQKYPLSSYIRLCVISRGLESRVKTHANTEPIPSSGDGQPILSRQEGKQRLSVCSWKPLTLSKQGFNHARSTDECMRNLCDVTDRPFSTVSRNKFPVKFEKLRHARDITKDSFDHISGSHVHLIIFIFSFLQAPSREREIIWHRNVLHESTEMNLQILEDRDSHTKNIRAIKTTFVNAQWIEAIKIWALMYILLYKFCVIVLYEFILSNLIMFRFMIFLRLFKITFFQWKFVAAQNTTFF